MTTDALQSALVDFVASSNLRDVVTYEHSAVRLGVEETGEEAGTTLEAKVRSEGTLFETRFRMTYADEECRAAADIGAIFEIAEGTPSPDPAVVALFLEQVGVMATFPYLRECIGTSAARLGVTPPVLGLLRRGDVTFGRGPGEGE